MESVFQHTEQHKQRFQALNRNGKLSRLNEDTLEVAGSKARESLCHSMPRRLGFIL